MARALLSKQSDYELVNKEQDVRGWRVLDGGGTVLGVVTEMIVDTDAERVELLRLDTGREIEVRDVQLRDHQVVVIPQTPPSAEPAAIRATEAVTLPVMEQELRVSKRAVVRGGVRIETRVEEQPVQQDITLREEQVSVERRPMDLPVSSGFIDQLPRGAVEVIAQAEVPVVAKEARVVEEVRVRRDVDERIEEVRDTVLRTDVDVEPVRAPDPSSRRRD